MGEYADYEIDRWIGDAQWGGRRRTRPRQLSRDELREQKHVYQARNPSRPLDFPDLTNAE